MLPHNDRHLNKNGGLLQGLFGAELMSPQSAQMVWSVGESAVVAVLPVLLMKHPIAAVLAADAPGPAPTVASGVLPVVALLSQGEDAVAAPNTHGLPRVLVRCVFALCSSTPSS